MAQFALMNILFFIVLHLAKARYLLVSLEGKSVSKTEEEANKNYHTPSSEDTKDGYHNYSYALSSYKVPDRQSGKKQRSK